MPLIKRPLRAFPRDTKELGKLVRSLTLSLTGDDALTDADIPATIARDSEVSAAVAASMTAHVSAGDPHPTYTTSAELAAAVTAHEGASDPHPGYTTAAELAAALAALNLDSGVWTPTLTTIANLDSLVAFSCQYLRVGNTVHCSGIVTVDPTAAADTQFGMSLPIASNIGAFEDLAGAGAAFTAQWAVAIYGDLTNNRAEFRFIAPDTTQRNVTFSFSYQVLP